MTKEEIGAVLRDLRLKCNMTQKEVAERIGRKQQIIGHWETGYSQPDANTLFTLCDVYETTIDEAFGFQKKHTDFTNEEVDIIKKYRELDEHGKTMVHFTLTEEHKHCNKDMEHAKIVQMNTDKDYLLPKAAHNDYVAEEGEYEKMQRDLAKLKRPD